MPVWFSHTSSSSYRSTGISITTANKGESTLTRSCSQPSWFPTIKRGRRCWDYGKSGLLRVELGRPGSSMGKRQLLCLYITQKQLENIEEFYENAENIKNSSNEYTEIIQHLDELINTTVTILHQTISRPFIVQFYQTYQHKSSSYPRVRYIISTSGRGLFCGHSVVTRNSFDFDYPSDCFCFRRLISEDDNSDDSMEDKS